MMALDIDSAIQQVLTCTHDLHCDHEKTCWIVANWAKAEREKTGVKPAENPAEPDDPDEVSDYAPGWGNVR